MATKKKKTAAPARPRPTKTVSKSADFPSFPLVSIGSSAGGLEPLLELLKYLPAQSGMAFVIIQHMLSRDESLLPPLLQKATAIPVLEVKEKMRLQANHIYVIPPGKTMEISSEGRFLLARPDSHIQTMPIDIFLRSQARAFGSQSIAILLSGAGSDGSLALHDIKAANGIVFVQDETAKFQSMPRNGLSTGTVDFVLPPRAIAERMVGLGKELREKKFAPSEDSETSALSDQDLSHLRTIFDKLFSVHGVDFAQYKQNTIRRRVLRRMLLHRLDSLKKYTELVLRDPSEMEALYQDLLIKVTHFFRDTECFEFLKTTVFSELIKKKNRNTPIRIWVPGCSTGEEAFSLAIYLVEHLGDMATNTSIQIFATDVSEVVLDKARKGRYIENISLDVSKDRLRRFFSKTDSHYQISKHIRDMCVFARHDITRDHPFSKMDLISCRNLLIYFNSHLQKRVFPAFHYALQPNGYLLLGNSESVGQFTDLFEPVGRKCKLFRRKAGSTSSQLHMNLSSTAFLHHASVLPPSEDRTPLPGRDIGREAEKIILAKYAPPGVVINRQMEILHFRGQTGKFLEPASGTPSLDLLKMVKPSLLLEVRRTVESAIRENTPISKEGLRFDAKFSSTVTLVVIPIKVLPRHEAFFLVLFEETQDFGFKGKGKKKSLTKSPVELPGKEAESRVKALQEELSSAKEYLQSIIEEQEATFEELKSANEEILSSNEELQSTNEEMETAKEELQSSNEELTTLNDELQNRNSELTHVNNDMVNLLSSVNVAIIMLERTLRIRRYTPMAEKAFNLIPADLGRPIGDLNLRMEIPNLQEVLTEVIDSIGEKELEVRDQAGKWFLLRIRPYKTSENKLDGAVLIFIDIDAMRRGVEQLQEARNFAEAIVETTRTPLLVLDDDLLIQAANPAFKNLFRISHENLVQQPLHRLARTPEEMAPLFRLLRESLPQGGQLQDFEWEQTFPQIGKRILLINARRLEGKTIPRALTLLSLEDVTANRNSAAEVLRLNDELRTRIVQLTRLNENLNQEAGHRQRTENELREAMKEAEAFSYSVSHDLRAPLRTVQGFAQVLIEDYAPSMDPKAREFAERIVSAAKRMDILIQDLLGYSRLSRSDMSMETVNLETALKEALDQLQQEIAEKHAVIEFRNPFPEVKAHHLTLVQVLANLISNAIKFTLPDMTPKLRIASETYGPWVCLRIEDNGIGIPVQHHKHIFQVFERLHGQETYPGNGIGLAIVRKGIEKMKGRYGLESEPGGGSRFWIELLAAKNEANPPQPEIGAQP